VMARKILGGYCAALTLLFLVPLSVVPQQKNAPSPTDIETMWESALGDTIDFHPDRVYPNLVAINECDKKLVWKGQPGNSPLLVVSWLQDYTVNSSGPSVKTGGDIWVTVVPELKDFCATHREEFQDPSLRLRQLLGLPPKYGANRFVEIWVNPNDLFRPGPDPEIGTRKPLTTFSTSNKYLAVSQDYINWFNATVNATKGRFPWTRLGYTYDWGNTQNHVGLSEFVIKAGSDIEISGVYKTEGYGQCGTGT
jgi:hypothetical protein